MKQIGIFTAVVVALAVGAVSFASNQETETKQPPNSESVFAGKAIIITPTVGIAGQPKENVRVELLAGRKYLVYEVKDEEGAYDYWMAADQVSRIRVFPTMKDATAFYDRRSEKGVFH